LIDKARYSLQDERVIYATIAARRANPIDRRSIE
jgi:hypothetical protein